MGAGTQTRRERGLAVAEIATRQHGVIARRQLLEVGFSEKEIETRLANGLLLTLRRDVYAVGHRRGSRRGEWLAAVLACGDDAVLSHATAAALWRLQGARGRIDVTAPRGRQGRPGRDGVRLHRARLFPGDVTEFAHIPVTSVARTLFDLSEVTDFSRLKRAAEEADRLRLLRTAALERLCGLGRGRRALRPIRRLLAEIRTPTAGRSPLEQRFASFCEAHRIPVPATNVLVLEHEVDALWPAARLIVELDSWEFHSHRAAFERDRTRDTERLLAGYRTIRITHRRLDKEAPVLAATIRQLLENT
jgi:hypothetical protein